MVHFRPEWWFTLNRNSGSHWTGIIKEDDELHFYSAELHKLNSNNEYAIIEYNKAIEYAKINGEDFFLVPYYYLNRGKYYLGKNELNQALNDFNYLLVLKPSFADGLINRGVCYFKLGKKSEACSDWSRASELNNTTAKTYLDKYCK